MKCAICVDGKGTFYAIVFDGRKKQEILKPIECPLCALPKVKEIAKVIRETERLVAPSGE